MNWKSGKIKSFLCVLSEVEWGMSLHVMTHIAVKLSEPMTAWLNRDRNKTAPSVTMASSVAGLCVQEKYTWHCTLCMCTCVCVREWERESESERERERETEKIIWSYQAHILRVSSNVGSLVFFWRPVLRIFPELGGIKHIWTNQPEFKSGRKHVHLMIRVWVQYQTPRTNLAILNLTILSHTWQTLSLYDIHLNHRFLLEVAHADVEWSKPTAFLFLTLQLTTLDFNKLWEKMED